MMQTFAVFIQNIKSADERFTEKNIRSIFDSKKIIIESLAVTQTKAWLTFRSELNVEELSGLFESPWYFEIDRVLLTESQDSVGDSEDNLERDIDVDPGGSDTKFDRRLGDPYAFALLTWPMMFTFLELTSSGWQLGLKVILAICLFLFVIASYSGQRTGRFVFGNCVVLSLCLVLFGWYLRSSYWVILILVLLVFMLYTAQRALFREAQSKIKSNSSEVP